MLFGLKNVGVMYQRLVNQMLAYHKGKTGKVYIGDMLVKSRKKNQYVAKLTKVFKFLNTYKMKLNLAKFAFAAGLRNNLRFMVSQ